MPREEGTEITIIGNDIMNEPIQEQVIAEHEQSTNKLPPLKNVASLE